MKRRFNETIDGSMQNIIQLKTLDNSLEFSQMYDALEDTPRDFQTKLIDALNSLGQTMGCSPEEAFNKVLCKSDDKNEGLRKKLYNWWRAFFEVLGKVVGNMPTVKSAEFTQKMDDLMAEIMKAGDAESSTEGEHVMESSTKPRFKKGDFVVVRNGDDARVLRAYRDRVDKSIWYEVWIMDGNRTTEFRDDDVYASRKEYEAKYLYEENYEQATKEDEDKMLADMDFAIQHLGEIANKVKAIVNFINPYCEKTFNEENNTMKFKKIDEGSTEWVDADKIFELAEEDSGSDDIVEHMMELGSDPDFIVEISGNKVLSDGAVEFQCIYKRDSSAMEEEPSDVKDLIRNEVEGMLEGTGWGVRNYKFSDDDDLMISWDSDKEPYAAFKVVVEQKMVELESGATKKVSLYVDWDDDGAGLDRNVVVDVPAEIADSEESTALYDYIMDWIDHQDFCVNDWVITDIEGLDKIDEGSEGGEEEKKPADVKDGEKQVTQDGETKTLVAGEENKKEMSDLEAATIMGSASATDMDAADMGLVSQDVADPYNKKPVCEMTIEQEIDDPWKLSELLWSQGKENLEELLRSELVGEEDIMQMLEDTGVRNLTNINDLFAFDFPSVLDSLGLDGQAWSKNLEIKPQGDDSEGDSKKDSGNEMLD